MIKLTMPDAVTRNDEWTKCICELLVELCNNTEKILKILKSEAEKTEEVKKTATKKTTKK